MASTIGNNVQTKIEGQYPTTTTAVEQQAASSIHDVNNAHESLPVDVEKSKIDIEKNKQFLQSQFDAIRDDYSKQELIGGQIITINFTDEYILNIINKHFGYINDQIYTLEFSKVNDAVNWFSNDYLEGTDENSGLAQVKILLYQFAKKQNITDIELLFNRVFELGGTIEDVKNFITKAEGDAEYLNSILGTASEEGGHISQAKEYVQTFGHNTLLDLINETLGKKYKSIDEITDEDLQSAVKTILNKHIENKDKYNNVDKKLFKNMLLSSIKGMTQEEYTKLYNAFIQAVSDIDEKSGFMIRLIKQMEKMEPAEAQAFLKSDKLRDLCLQSGLNYNKIYPVLSEMVTQLSNKGLDTIEGLIEFSEKFDIDNYHKSLLEKRKNGELSEHEQEFLAKFELIKKIEEKYNNNETLTEAEQKLYDEYIKKHSAFDNAAKTFALKLMQTCDGDVSKFEDYIKEWISKEPKALAEAIAEYENYDTDFTFDTKFFDELTDGKFSTYVEEFRTAIAESNNSQNNHTVSSESTLEMTPKGDISSINQSRETIENFFDFIRAQEQDDSNTYYVYKNDETTDSAAITNPTQKYKFLKNLSVNDIRNGLSKQELKVSDILHQYKNLSQSGKDFVEGLIKTMPKNSQYYYLKCIPSNIAVVALIKHAKINPEGFDIEASLDYASRKEVERIKERQDANISM